MPPTPFFTAGGAVNPLSPDDEDDDDICPVCDGDCTCDNRPRIVPVTVASASTHAPSAVAHSVVAPVASTSSSSHAPTVQPLKIKLTVPTSMQNRARNQPAQPKKSRGGAERTGTHGPAPSSDLTKRKGRKLAATSQEGPRLSAQERLTGASEQSTLPRFHYQSQSQHHRGQRSYGASSRNAAGKQKIPSNASRLSVKSTKQKGKSVAVKKGSSSKKNIAARDESHPDLAFEDENLRASVDDDDTGSFPTFLSASALSSGDSSDSSSELESESTGFDSDSSLEAEEETYILSEQRRQEKARVRRELLGDETHRRKDIHNNWVIRPRKKSVGLSDVEMDSDNDDTSNGEEDEEEEEEEMEAEDDDETDDHLPSRRFKGLVTSWSESEESAFDADIFFANLSSSDSDFADDGESFERHAGSAEQESAIATPATPRTMDFEVTEGWDGQVVFTNGLTSNQVVDMDFEVHAVQLASEDGASATQSSDVEMRNSEGDEGGYEEDEEFDDGDNGDTTEEELVDERGLPTSRAMRMFQWPASVSAINPLSIVSPTVSPAPNNRRTTSASRRPVDSPRPADILAGRVFFDESDEHPDSGESSGGGRVRVVSRAGEPLMGQFDVEPETPQKTAILTGANKDIPSPFPRLHHRRRRFSSSAGSFGSMDFRGRTLSRFDVFTSGPLSLTSSEDPFSETSSKLPLGEQIDLDDVLDSSYLNDTSASEYPAMSSTASEGESNPQNFYRWDRVPVSAFRLTREGAGDVVSSPGWTSEPPTSNVGDHVLSYANLIKNSPLSTVLWHDRGLDVNDTPTKPRNAVTISPVLIPSRDGDRTPVPTPQPPTSSTNQQQSHKTRKESRREMKRLKRKLYGPVHSHYSHHQQHQFRQHHHYHHNHHPNAKLRGAVGVQRMKYSSPSTIPPLNL